jgi:hypothetical protein
LLLLPPFPFLKHALSKLATGLRGIVVMPSLDVSELNIVLSILGEHALVGAASQLQISDIS